MFNAQPTGTVIWDREMIKHRKIVNGNDDGDYNNVNYDDGDLNDS